MDNLGRGGVMKSLGLIGRIGLIVGLIIVLNLVSLAALFWAKWEYRKTEKLVDVYIEKGIQIEDLKYQFTRWKVNVLSGMFNLAEFRFSTKALEEDLQGLSAHTTEERAFVTEINQKYREMKALSAKILQMLANADQWEDEDELREALLDLYNEKFSPLTKQIYKILDQGLENTRKELSFYQKVAEKRLLLVSFLQLATVFLSVLALLALGLYLHRKLKWSLSALDEALTLMAQGNFSHQVPVKGHDEIAQMLAKINQTFEELGPIIRKIRSISSDLDQDARDLRAFSEEAIQESEHTQKRAGRMQRRAEGILSHVEAEARGVNEISTAIQEISQNTTKASQVTNEAVEKARLAQEVIHRVGEVSREIESVIQLITNVTEQTKFLALNATIEAARAGEAGKGFAVVANEVKELAHQTAEATGEITQKIRAMQNESSQAVQAADEIVNIIEEINQIASAIAAAVEEQTAVITEMAEKLENTRQEAETLSAEGQEAYKAASEALEAARKNLEYARGLSNLAQEMASLVAQFKV